MSSVSSAGGFLALAGLAGLGDGTASYGLGVGHARRSRLAPGRLSLSVPIHPREVSMAVLQYVAGDTLPIFRVQLRYDGTPFVLDNAPVVTLRYRARNGGNTTERVCDVEDDGTQGWVSYAWVPDELEAGSLITQVVVSYASSFEYGTQADTLTWQGPAIEVAAQV